MRYDHIYSTMVELVCNLPGKTNNNKVYLAYWERADEPERAGRWLSYYSKCSFVQMIRRPPSNYSCCFVYFLFNSFWSFSIRCRGQDISKVSLLQDIHRQDHWLSPALTIRKQGDVRQEALPAVQQCLKETQLRGQLVSDMFIQQDDWENTLPLAVMN